MTESPREALFGGAQLVELDTQGFLPAVGFTKMIDEGLIAHAADAGELKGFFPINVKLDGAYPAEAKNINDAFTFGCAACFDERVVLAWMKGIIRAKVGSYVVHLANVSDAKIVDFGNVPGVDVTLPGGVLSLVFSPKLDAGITGSWALELAELLCPGSVERQRAAASLN